MTGRPSTDSNRSPSNESRMHSCSVVVSASNTSPHSVCASTLISRSVAASVVSDGAVVVLLEVVVVLVGMVVVLRAVVVLLTAVDVDSCVESPPQPARTMATGPKPQTARSNGHWIGTPSAPTGYPDRSPTGPWLDGEKIAMTSGRDALRSQPAPPLTPPTVRAARAIRSRQRGPFPRRQPAPSTARTRAGLVWVMWGMVSSSTPSSRSIGRKLSIRCL